MVAACATAPSAAVAATSYQTGLIIFGDCEKGQPMATAASSTNNSNGGHQNNRTLMATMAAVTVDQLRQQLQLGVENNDLTAASALIGQLENAILNKETLEATRIGRYVNELRKQTAQQWPDFSKRCRSLIKQWQKIAEYRPSSSCEGSSNGGTPQLVSPALRRGLTPRTTTPGKRITPQQQYLQQRVTSTELQLPQDIHYITGQLSSSISQMENGIAASGSYAPFPHCSYRKISPQLATIVEQQHQQFIHKSASVGATMCHLEGSRVVQASLQTETNQRIMPNGVELITDDPFAVAGGTSSSNSADAVLEAVAGPSAAASRPQNPPPLTLKLKRSASGVQRWTEPSEGSEFATISAASQTQSVHAARKDVQSTAKLVAQLSETLPPNIGIDLSTKTIDTTVKCEESPPIETNVIASANDETAEKQITIATKRRYHTRKGGREGSEESVKAVADQVKFEDNEVGDAKERSNEEKEEKKAKLQEEKGKSKKGKGRKKDKQAKFNWFAEYSISDEESPSSSTLCGGEVNTDIAQARAAPTRSFVLSTKDRQVVLLPYVDIGLPDWKTHELPQQERFFFPDPTEWTSK